ncbi:MAG: hypothetical protein PF481_10510 [Bacteroidales bacterium]|jgi:hypothetical protein|nr:hypothetical protein [Bacteroidales bacterium]
MKAHKKNMHTNLPYNMKKIHLILTFTFLCIASFAQNEKITFNGTTRGMMEHNWLPPSDTLNIDNNIGGDALVDLRLNILPIENIRVSATLRLKNEIGGFWGQGAGLELREIYIKGVAGKYFKYKFGDIDHKMTPYTLFNNEGEFSQFDPEIFNDIRSIQLQENFNYGNAWRQQGGMLSTRLGFDSFIHTSDLSAFVFRNRSLSDGVTPDRLQGGAQAYINITETSHIGINYINLFDLPKTVSNSEHEKYNNDVTSISMNIDASFFTIIGEAGTSGIHYIDTNNVNTINREGNFFEVGIQKTLKSNRLTLSGTFRRVSDDFFSAGAQSKRIDYSQTPELFETVSPNMYTRSVNLLDMIKDASVYNQTITPELMAYNPVYNHVTPYGQATPNRQGFTFKADYTDSLHTYTSQLGLQLLRNVRGEGTEELRNYILAQWDNKINLHTLFDLQKTLALTGGVQYARSDRDGLGLVSDVNLRSTSCDIGVEKELVNRFDVLIGAHYLVYKGTEYLSIRNEFNVITDYNLQTYDGTQGLYSMGFRYRFNDNIFLTLQGNQFNLFDAKNSDNDYQINQVFILFNLMF